MFKIGDKVRFSNNTYCPWFTMGIIYEIIPTPKNNINGSLKWDVFLISNDGDPRGADTSELELVEPLVTINWSKLNKEFSV